MAGTASSSPAPTKEQITVWLRGLLTIAWADGHYDEEEQAMIAEITHDQLADVSPQALEIISPEELANVLNQDPKLAENFLRTAVMVAIADGVYSPPEDEVLEQFCQALGQDPQLLASLRLTLFPPRDQTSDQAAEATIVATAGSAHPASDLYPEEHKLDPLHPVRDWLDQMEMHDPKVAKFLCKMIPPQCPFERDVQLFGKKLVHIPPLCKLNPLYEQLVGLRFRALSYLADECGEDVTPYC